MKKVVLCLLVAVAVTGVVCAGTVHYACGHVRSTNGNYNNRRSDKKCPSCVRKDEEAQAKKQRQQLEARQRQQAEARQRQQAEARQQAVAKAASAGRNAARNDQSNGTGYNPNSIVNTFSSSEERDACYQAYNEEFNTIERVKRGTF